MTFVRRWVWVAAALLCAFNLTAALAARAAGCARPAGGLIAFEASDRDTSPDLMLADVRRGLRAWLVRHPAHDCCLDWHPNGREVVFRSNRDGRWELYRMYLGGQPVRLTDNPAAEASPVWSPDGRQIAFVSDRAGSLDLYLLDADDGSVHRLTDDPASEFDPVWSPDGRYLAFVSQRGGAPAITIQDRGGAAWPLTGFSAEQRIASWSPDGTRLAFVAISGGVEDIYVAEVAACRIQPDDCARRLTDHPLSDFSPVWSPDSQQIVFVSARDGSLNLYLTDAAGQHTLRLTRTVSSEMSPAWSPDGQHLAFVARRPSRPEIILMDVPAALAGAPCEWTLMGCHIAERRLIPDRLWQSRPLWQPEQPS
jgi:TolB protein